MSKVQAVTFDKSVWTTANARSWLHKNGFERLKPVDTTTNRLRYRIRQPRKGAQYITKDVGHGIQLIIEFAPPIPGQRRRKK